MNTTQPIYCCFIDQRPGEPVDDEPPRWLGPGERSCHESLRGPRARAWLLGRMAAKQLILAWLDDRAGDPRQIEIHSRDELGRAVRPSVHHRGQPLECSLSISHAGGSVAAALCAAPGAAVGIDLAPVEDFGEGFLRVWFTPAEQQWAREAGPAGAASVWAAKEAVYKACNRGEPFAPRRIDLRPGAAGEFVCRYGRVDLAADMTIRVARRNGHVAATALLGRGPWEMIELKADTANTPQMR